ncbi:MAG: ABC transporter transmembrane domain-containing protein [Chloroflexota bacterium]
MAPGLIRAGRAGPLGPEARLLASWPRARSQLSVAVALGVGAALCAIAIAVLLADAVAQVFLGGLGLADVTPRLMGALALAMVRAACLMGQEVVAQRASSGLRAGLRDRLTTHLLALGPLRLTGERTGELVTALGSGMDDVDAWATGYRTARGLAVVVPVLVVLVVAALDPPTAVVLILTGPVLILLLAVIGSRTRAIGARRAAELRWLGGFFLDMLQGLATLRMFGRGQEQVATIRDVSRQYGETTMEVLRTAFQTALVLEWSAAVATAVVAVEVSLRLIDGHIAFDRALMVLVITPECFLPLRQLALRYHSGAAGRAAAQRAFQILDTPAPATMPPPAPVRASPVPLRRPHPRGRAPRCRRPTSVSRGSGRPMTARHQCCVAWTSSCRGHRSPRWWAHPVPARRPAPRCCSGSWRPIRAHHGRRHGPCHDRAQPLAGGGGVGATTAAPVPGQRRGQHPAGSS